jgi:dinuclear metal center YbgI/SA1388 family protein
MTVRLSEVVEFLDATLEIDKFRDYGPNGLQVESGQEVDTVVTAVSVSLELFELAAEVGADLIVVHHGLVWDPGLRSITGPLARRLGCLLKNGISLAAYHLPLDKHARLGNNVGLCDAVGIGPTRASFGEVRGQALGLTGAWSAPISRVEAVSRVCAGVLAGAPPQFVFPYGPELVRKVGLCSGAASDLLEAAAASGCDMFVTGELSERAEALAKELQITLVAAGHYATEVFGPQRLVDEIRRRFVDLDVRFIDVPSPL